MTKGGRQTITPPTPEVTRPVPEQPSGLRMDEQGASRLIVRQHGEQEEKNEFEEMVSIATSLQGSKPAQVLTLEWRKPHTDGHRVAGSDIMSVGNLEMTAGLLRLGNDFLMSTRHGLQEWLEDEVNAESSEEGGNYFNATVLVAWFKPFSPDALMLDKRV